MSKACCVTKTKNNENRAIYKDSKHGETATNASDRPTTTQSITEQPKEREKHNSEGDNSTINHRTTCGTKHSSFRRQQTQNAVDYTTRQTTTQSITEQPKEREKHITVQQPTAKHEKEVVKSKGVARRQVKTSCNVKKRANK